QNALASEESHGFSVQMWGNVAPVCCCGHSSLRLRSGGIRGTRQLGGRDHTGKRGAAAHLRGAAQSLPALSMRDDPRP
ncbi:hypothetical protein, partial [Stenotrophomonas maltophilia]|uniref:hypothetical protein n=1 Tax=Stenotrophomonas maltophilia TaxID=40324 RepID=UPI001953AC39